MVRVTSGRAWGARAPGLAVAAPGLAFLLVAAWTLAAALIGAGPLAAPPALTLPEASALRDDGEILGLIAGGADPNAVGRVGEGYLRSPAYEMTPLEAAVGARRLDTVQLLLREGARIERDDYPRLLCFARLEGANDIVAFLESLPASDTPVDCAAVETPW